MARPPLLTGSICKDSLPVRGAGRTAACGEHDAANWRYADGVDRGFSVKLRLSSLPRALGSPQNRSGRKPCFFLDVRVRDGASRQL
jgi:hypothetical protein